MGKGGMSLIKAETPPKGRENSENCFAKTEWIVWKGSLDIPLASTGQFFCCLPERVFEFSFSSSRLFMIIGGCSFVISYKIDLVNFISEFFKVE
jgi:hypothetical protein